MIFNDGTPYRPLPGSYCQDALPLLEKVAPGLYSNPRVPELWFDVVLLDRDVQGAAVLWELQYGRLHHPSWDFHRGVWGYTVSFHHEVLRDQPGEVERLAIEPMRQLCGEAGPDWDALWRRGRWARVFHVALYGDGADLSHLPNETWLFHRGQLNPPTRFAYAGSRVEDPLTSEAIELLILPAANRHLARLARARGVSVEHQYPGAPFRWA